MFEKCGVLDILYALRKYAVAILAIVAACLVLGVALSAVTAAGNPPPPVTPDELEEEDKPVELIDEWVSSVCFEVAVQMPASATAEDRQLAENKAAATLLALSKADFTREAVYNELLKTYTAQDFVDAFGLEVEPKDLTQFDLKSVLEGSIFSSTSVVNLYLQSTDKQLSDDYLTLIKQEVVKRAEAMDNVSVSFYGGVLSAMKVPAPEEEGETEEADDTYAVSFTKYWLLLPALGIFLAVLAIVFKAMFFPTVNRRSDVAAYGLPVIAEVDRRLGKKSVLHSLPFNARALADHLKEQQVRTCAVVTTLKNTEAVQQTLADMTALLQQQGRTVALVSSLSELPDTAFESALVFAGNLNADPAALDVVAQCDHVLLVEKYGTTTHHAFYEIKDVLELENCHLLGVATI